MNRYSHVNAIASAIFASRYLFRLGSVIAMILLMTTASASTAYAQPLRPRQPVMPKSYEATDLSILIQKHEKGQIYTFSQSCVVHQREDVISLRDAYMDHGVRSDKWDKSMLAAIEKTIKFREDHQVHAYRDSILPDLAAARDAGCTDARMYYLYAYAMDYANNNEVYIALGNAAKQLDKNNGQDRFMLMLVKARIAEMAGKLNDIKTAIAANRDAREVFLGFLEHDLAAYGPSGDSIWVPYLPFLLDPITLTPESERDLQAFYAKVQQVKDIKPWVPAYIRGRGDLVWAWKARGSGLAYTVTDNGWKVWEAKTKLAYGHALRAHKLNPKQPYAATLLIELCWGNHAAAVPEQHPRYWFEQAVAAQIDYSNAYETYAFGQLPRWGGTFDDQYKFGLECAKTDRFDTDIPRYSLYSIINILRDADALGKVPDEIGTAGYQIVEYFFKGQLKKEKDPLERQRLQNQWFYWTWKLQRPVQVLEVYLNLDKPYDPKLVYRDGSTYSLPQKERFETFIRRLPPQ